MRRILVENARLKSRKKRGGDAKRIPLDDVPDDQHTSPLNLLALDEALTDLESNDQRAADLVKLRYFAGFSHVETAKALGITRREADRSWKLAKAWLFNRLKSD